MSCILRAAGKKFNVEDFLKISKLKPCAVYRKGEPRFKTKPKSHIATCSGVNIKVSNADFSNLKKQIKDTVKYLEKNKNEVKKLAKFPGLDSEPNLDFGIALRDVPAQSDYFPPELLLLAGKLGIGIEFSLYSIKEESEGV